MKWLITVLLVFVTVQFIVGAYVDIGISSRLAEVEDRLEKRDYRITQLECALAQAHAENDTLEVMLENMDARTGGGARWLR